METHLAEWLRDTPDGIEAESILRKCVHCGFCTATCPTYQLLGDELDGPRGRIYLIKQVVEGAAAGPATLAHLDRCLTCRNCESTCPSGVAYGHLVDVGRRLVEKQVRRPLGERVLRTALRQGLTRRWLFGPAMRAGKVMRPMLPAGLRDKVPASADDRLGRRWPRGRHERRVLLLNGCVQPAMMPNIDAATARVLDRLGVQAIVERRSGCCGAIRHHLNDEAGARKQARRNIDAWARWLDGPQAVEAIVINASGCGAMLKDYGHLLRDDGAYAERARRVSAMTRDLAEWLPEFDAAIRAALPPDVGTRAAFHPPCTLQHGQQIKGAVERLLAGWGVSLTPVADSHLCCGSAGTYSVLQPELSRQLRDRKLASLLDGQPQVILSANIGCLTHLQSGTQTRVRHWIEWLDEQLRAASSAAPAAPSEPAAPSA
ncbi:MAG: glycolate oxidase subunit GlcF [Burkholderiaceae bacterium]